MFETRSLALLAEALGHLEGGFTALPAYESALDLDGMRPVLLEVAERMRNNYPYPHPLYAGQMIHPPHPIARLAYALAQQINPNNHALDGGLASTHLEKEAVAQLAAMFGWESHLGHLTGGGTMANLEALWVANKVHPGKKILASAQAHYTHERISNVLQIPYETVPADCQARMDLNALEDIAKKGEVGTVVATMGTSSLGAVDPLVEILELGQKYGFRVHADAAYGGYFVLSRNLSEATARSFGALDRVDSLVVDPHKHGLQPYGCGCVLLHDPTLGRFYKHDSPYTYFTSQEMHLGEVSLECSRAGAAAVALWATQRYLPLEKGGQFARHLEDGRLAALGLHAALKTEEGWLAPFDTDLDIVVWGVEAPSASQASAAAQAIFDRAAERDLHLALARVSRGVMESHWPELEWDQEDVTCLRSCLMRSDHLIWLERILTILRACQKSALAV